MAMRKKKLNKKRIQVRLNNFSKVNFETFGLKKKWSNIPSWMEDDCSSSKLSILTDRLS